MLDLICSVYSITTGTLTASILTSPQNAIEVPQWPSLGSFTAISTADTSQRASFRGALRFVRYKLDITGGGVAYVEIKGYARTEE